MGLVEIHDEVDSTNRRAEELARQGCPEGTVVVARRQTSGRGRRDHSWHSPEGGLWLTVVTRPPRVEGLSLVAGLALLETCQGQLPELPLALHWPNDLYSDGRKVAGILVETRFQGSTPKFALVGVGLNVNNRDFPAEIRETAASLSELSGAPLDLALLQDRLLSALGQALQRFAAEGLSPFLPQLRRHCAMLGRPIEWEREGERHRTRALDLSEQGGLVLEDGSVLTSADRVSLVD